MASRHAEWLCSCGLLCCSKCERNGHVRFTTQQQPHDHRLRKQRSSPGNTHDCPGQRAFAASTAAKAATTTTSEALGTGSPSAALKTATKASPAGVKRL
eukprot:9034440-Alexandrium_andersonii.AAC.1